MSILYDYCFANLILLHNECVTCILFLKLASQSSVIIFSGILYALESNKLKFILKEEE